MQNLLNNILIQLAAVLIVICFSSSSIAQSNDLDIKLFKTKNSIKSELQPHFTHKVEDSSKGLLFGLLNFYKRNISKQISAECLFEISCSTFSQMALREYGIVKGIALTADRLSRCNRISGTTINEYRINENGKVNDIPSMYKINNE